MIEWIYITKGICYIVLTVQQWLYSYLRGRKHLWGWESQHFQLWCGRPGGFIDSHSFLVHVRRSAQLGSDVMEWWGYQKQQYNWCTHQQVVKRGRRKQWLFPPASYVLLHPLWGRILCSGLVVLEILLRPGRGVFLSWLQIQCQGFCWQGLFCPSWSNQFSSAFVLWFHSAPRPHITYVHLT